MGNHFNFGENTKFTGNNQFGGNNNQINNVDYLMDYAEFVSFSKRITSEIIRIEFIMRNRIVNKVRAVFPELSDDLLSEIIAQQFDIKEEIKVIEWYLNQEDPSKECYRHEDRLIVATLCMKLDLEKAM